MASTTTRLERGPRPPALTEGWDRWEQPLTVLPAALDGRAHLGEDAVAWRSVCAVLIGVVAAGALAMAIVVAAIVFAS